MGTQSTWGVCPSLTTMMFTILASSLVLLAAVTEGRPHESEWQTYKAIHGKEYSAEEDLMRFSRWLQNKEMVDAHNKADHGYKMALMEHSDWTEEEMNQWIGDWSQEPGTVWKLLGILCYWSIGGMLDIEGCQPVNPVWRVLSTLLDIQSLLLSMWAPASSITLMVSSVIHPVVTDN